MQTVLGKKIDVPYLPKLAVFGGKADACKSCDLLANVPPPIKAICMYRSPLTQSANYSNSVHVQFLRTPLASPKGRLHSLPLGSLVREHPHTEKSSLLRFWAQARLAAPRSLFRCPLSVPFAGTPSVVSPYLGLA